MPRGRITHISLPLILFMGIFIVSCSVEKNTGATRNFHNLTSHYNIYFNGLESYKQGIIRAEESFLDDYTTLLPLFYYEDESIQQSVAPQMKRAIDKSTKVITFHSITAKPKVNKGRQSEKDKAFYDKNEYNKWVDDCYVLIGKAYMLQGEFFMAAESFKHAIKNFPEEESYYLALPWLVRAYNVLGELDESEEIVVALKDIDEYPKKYEEVLYTSLADYHIRKEEFDNAAEYLEKALKTRPTKSNKIRYTYILAQLYKEAGMGEASVQNYKKVVRMNPPYVMAFNAKVSMAEAFQSGSAGSAEIRKLLLKMLKDSKNKEYLDQIYFALGNISMEEGDREKAIDYYHLSVSSSVQNSYQKGESCLTLAQLYYKEPKYTLSAAYYDTAVNLLEADYPNYTTLQLRSRSLNNLVQNINTYELQDSVQRLAGMSEAERLQVIDGIIEQIRKEEEEARLKQQQALQDLQYSRSELNPEQTGFGGTGSSAGGKWYFYNLNAKSFGQPEFRMKWGERKLEDNWRRSNKQTMTVLLEEAGVTGAENGDSTATVIIDNKSREFYLRDIPLTDSALNISNVKLEEALYNMAMIYRNDLLDYKKAIESLELLVSKYTDGAYTMASYYYLHDLYNTVQNPQKANEYKTLLSRKYPDSHMAKLLTNPNYINELDQEAKRVEQYYEDVYTDYKNGRYADVIRKATPGITTYADDKDMVARLSYLKALSTGALRGKEALKTELDTIVARFPDTEIAMEAKDIIDYMYVAFPVIKEADQVKEAVQLYTFAPNAPHKFMIALKKSENLNLLNFNLLNYNLDNFNNYDLQIELQKPGVDYNLLVISSFTDLEGLKRYMQRVKEDASEIMGEIPSDAYSIVRISNENYSKLLKAKEVTPYLLFYRQNYTE